MQQNRRTAIATILGAGASIALPPVLRARVKALDSTVKFGVITDTHIGFVPKAEERLSAFLREMRMVGPDGLIQMGDFAHPNEKNQEHVDRFNKASQHPIHAIGNHELDHGLTREDARDSWGIPGFYYSKKVMGIQVIVLDGNDKGSPTYASHGGYHSYIGDSQRHWLKEELEAAECPVLIISHQPLAGRIAIDNAKEVQALISLHRDRILVCLNGHSHVDQHLEIEGVNYVHVNSASYYWLGGKVRLATYRDPLFTTMTIDAEAGTVSFSGVNSEWAGGTPEDAGYFKDGENEELKPIVQPRISEREFAPRVLSH